MKKLLMLFLALALCFTLASCTNGLEESNEPLPPALSLLQKQTTLAKHSERGKSASFSKQDFENALGEEVESVTVTSLPDAELGTLIFNGSSIVSGQTIHASSLEYLKFVPTAECKTALFCFTCECNSFENVELSCEIVYADTVNSPPIATDCEIETFEGIPCAAILDINEPNGDDFVINVISYPTDGFVSISQDGYVVYTPEDGFSGSDRLVYSITDKFGAISESAILSITVGKNENGLKFADMSDDPMQLYAYKMCERDVMVYRFENGEYYFDPELTVSKIDFLVMLMNLSGENRGILAVADSVVSDDAGLSSGLKGYLSAAAEKDLIKLENGAFSPKEPCTVADAAYMISSLLKFPRMDSESIQSGESDRSFASLIAASDAGIFDTVDPEHKLTKAETADILCRVYNYMQENNMIAAIDNFENK